MKIWGLLVVCALLLISLGSAKIIPYYDCGSNYLYQQGNGGNSEYVYGNGCLELIMRSKNYDTNIEVYDKLNDRNFRLMVNRIEERNNVGSGTSTTTLTSMGLVSDIEKGFPVWRNSNTMFGYLINGSSFKVVANITNWNYDYSDSNLWLDYRYHKNSGDKLVWSPVIVDGVEIPIENESRVSGQNTFISQNIGRGYEIIIDPTIDVSINASVPSRYLYLGNNRLYNYSQFSSYNDITSDISDGDSSTSFQTWVALNSFPNLVLGFSFNQLLYTTTVQEFSNNHDALIIGTVKPIRFQDTYYGAYFDGNSYMTVLNNTNINIADLGSQTACVIFNKSEINTQNEFFYDTKGIGSTGIRMFLKNDGSLVCDYFGSSDHKDSKDNSVNVRDNNLHLACCRKFDDTLDLWVDGVKRHSENKNFGSISGSYNMNFMADANNNNRMKATVKQFGIINSKISDADMLLMNDVDGLGTKSLADLDLGGSIEVYYNHSFDITEKYFLKAYLNITDVSVLKVIPYSDMNTPDWANSKDFTVSNGVNFLDIQDIIYNGYNLPFRIYDILGVAQSKINDVYLFETINDTNPPTISNCQVDVSSVLCGEPFTFSCDVVDEQGIGSVNFLLNHSWDGVISDFANKNGDNYFYNDAHLETFTGVQTINFSTVNATDLLGNSIIYHPNLVVNYSCFDPNYFINISHFSNSSYQINISEDSVELFWKTNNASNSSVDYGVNSGDLNLNVFNSDLVYEHYINLTGLTPSTNYFYTLTSAFNPSQTSEVFNFTTLGSCVEDWVNQPFNNSLCRTNNTLIQTNNYVDLNNCGTFNNVPLDNGSSQENYCNYCDSDWNELTGGIHDCQANNTRFVEYIDYNSCYSVTGLLEDSAPLDQQTWVSCAYFTNDFSCDIADVPFFKGKMEYTCELPYVDTEFKCLSIVSYGFDDILQVNPQKSEKSNSLLAIGNDVESREYFTTSLGLLNAYYTNKNIIPEQSFLVTTRCTDGSQTLVHQFEVNPELQNLDSLPTYSIWFRENFAFIFGGLVILMVIALFSFGFIKSRGSYR